MDHFTDLPIDFSQRILGAFGNDGEQWLESLASIIRRVCSEWSLTPGSYADSLSYNYVAPAVRKDGSKVVLKLGVPNPELSAEIEALRCYAGHGCVQLLDADAESGAILLERVEPGQPVLDLEDDESATAIAARIINRLHKCQLMQGPYPTVAEWGLGLERLRAHFDGGTGPFPSQLVERAESNLRDLLSSEGEPVLLHGDLHHWNILSSERADWVAIDPKGVIGEPEYETGAWLRNPFPKLQEWPDAKKVTARRIDQFAEHLGYDHERVLAWGIYQAVLAAWWSFESSDAGYERWIAIAEILNDIDG